MSKKKSVYLVRPSKPVGLAKTSDFKPSDFSITQFSIANKHNWYLGSKRQNQRD